MHFDATGRLIRMSTQDKKRVYVYSAVVNVNGTLISLFEMINSQHDQSSIGSVFAHFRHFCEGTLKRTWPVVGRFISDCSFAIIHAVILQWNSMSLSEYLRKTFKYPSGTFTAKDFSKVVFIHLCKNHWIKLVSMNLKGHLIRGVLRVVILESMSRLMETKSLHEFKNLFRSFLILLLSPSEHEGINEAFRVLSINEKCCDFEVPTITNLAEEIEEHAFQTTDKLTDTPFYVMCSTIIEGVKWELQYVEEGNKNRCHCTEGVCSLKTCDPTITSITLNYTSKFSRLS